MKIDIDFIKKIFNMKIKLSKIKDKIKLSQYEDLIPMYDIYSQKIYPINKQNIHYRLIEAHYRIINHEIYKWLTNLYDKYKSDKILGAKFKYNLDVLDNYDIDTLIETSYTSLYKYSPLLGLSISICKRNSFNPYIQHLKPYYTKLELIKLGQNMNLIKSDINLEYLIDQDIHYNICKTVSSNDVSFDEIKSHHQYIIDKKLKSWICFYSFTGSFLFNKYLRNIKQSENYEQIRSLTNNLIADNYLDGLKVLVNQMENSPELINNYDIYRFIWDDSFLINLKEGDIFTDFGFLSTTRDPFYSPGLSGHFGLILVKIKIPKNKKGVGLFIENFSMFPKEEEFLLPPYSKLKLLSKNDNFKYYHILPEFEKLINRKYEFELIDVNYSKFKIEYLNKKTKLLTEKILDETISSNEIIPNINLISINGIDRIDLIKQFISLYSSNNKINLKVNNSKKIYSFNFNWFDSSSGSSYSKYYYNNIRDGFLLSIFDEFGYPYLNIELGQFLAINYLNKLYFGENILDFNKDKDIIDLIFHIGRIFYYKSALIWHKYNSFIEFNNNYSTNINIFLHMGLYNDTIYRYLKYNEEFISSNPFISFDIGYWYLDEYFNKSISMINIPEELIKCKNNKELYIEIVEKYFNFYPKMLEQMDKNIISKAYVKFDIYEKLKADGIIENFKPYIEHSKSDILDDDFKLVFRQPIRRI
jgi:hypothetical protein